MKNIDKTKNENKHKSEIIHIQSSSNVPKLIPKSNSIDLNYPHSDNMKTTFEQYLNQNCNNMQQITKILNKSEPILDNNKKNKYSEVYVPKNNGLNFNNTFVMTFCNPSLCDYYKKLFCIKNYKYDDYIEYTLFKKHNKKHDIYVEYIIVEKNAIHCQGLVKKIVIIKNNYHVPKKIIFVK